MRTAHSPPAVPLGQALFCCFFFFLFSFFFFFLFFFSFFLFFFFFESNLRSEVSRFETGYFLPFVVFVVVVAFRPAPSAFL